MVCGVWLAKDTKENHMAEALANPVAPVEYPESDDTPVESMKQWNVVAQVVMALRRFLGRRALVAANMGVYYRRGDPSGLIVPDLFVAMGTPKIETPDVYLTWEQGKPPDLAMEVASKTTFRRDRREKIAIYRRLGVKEYFLHDATDRFLKPRLQGFRMADLSADAGGERSAKKPKYEPIEPTILPNGGLCLHSKVLNLDIHALRGEPAPQLFGPDGTLLLSHEDAAEEERRLRLDEQRRRIDEQRRRIEEERRRVDEQHRRLEEQRLRVEEQRHRQEEARKRMAAERELVALRKRLADLEER